MVLFAACVLLFRDSVLLFCLALLTLFLTAFAVLFTELPIPPNVLRGVLFTALPIRSVTLCILEVLRARALC